MPRCPPRPGKERLGEPAARDPAARGIGPGGGVLWFFVSDGWEEKPNLKTSEHLGWKNKLR